MNNCTHDCQQGRDSWKTLADLTNARNDTLQEQVKLLRDALGKCKFDSLNMTIADMQSIGEALAATQSSAVPAGWKVVPVEATEEMLCAGGDYLDGDSFCHADKVYKAMLSAAPEAPQAQDKDPL